MNRFTIILLVFLLPVVAFSFNEVKNKTEIRLNNKHLILKSESLRPEYFMPIIPSYSFGIKPGINYSNIVFKNFLMFQGNKQGVSKEGIVLSYTYSQVSPVVDLFGSVGLNKYFSIQAELIYDNRYAHFSKGFSFVDAPTAQTLDFFYEFGLRNEYLTIPVTTKFTFGKDFKVSAFAGLYYSFLMKSKTKTYQTYEVVEFNQVRKYIDSYTYNSIDYYKKYDSGMTIGIGFQYPIWKYRLGPTINLLIEARYNLGFSAIDNYNIETADFFGKPIDAGNDVKYRTYTFLTGITVDLKAPRFISK